MIENECSEKRELVFFLHKKKVKALGFDPL